MNEIELIDRLSKQLTEPLPGAVAQRQFAHELSYGRHQGPPSWKSRQAAVLALLVWDGTQWTLPLTKRPAGQGVHSGQICFAGGGIEAGETDVQAALRECQEETGWAPAEHEVIGRLSPLYVYASDNWVSCVVAATRAKPSWQPDRREVAELIPLPLSAIGPEAKIGQLHLDRHGVHSRARCFQWQEHSIWGATCMMLAELQSVLFGNLSDRAEPK